jgi:transposase
MEVKYRQYNSDQMYFTIIDPEDIKSHNPLLLAVHTFVEEHVTISPFSEKVSNELGGAPAVHPKMMLKVLFYSYANGVYSSREIEERFKWDQNYIFLSGNQKVDHSTICNFILQYEEEIKDIFSKLIYVMANLGYVTMNFIAVDGTKIRANAGRRFTGDVEEFRGKRKRIENKIEEILNHTMDEELSKRYKVRKENKLKDLQCEKGKIDTFLREVEENKYDKDQQREKINLTDRDARIVKDKDTKYIGYNCQIGVDEGADVIVGAQVFNDASERGLLHPMIENLKRKTGNNLQEAEIGFDAGYFSSDNLGYCNEVGVKIYLPEGRGESGEKQRESETIESRDCKLEIEGDKKILACPGGQVMESTEPKKDRGNYFYRFYPKREDCQECQGKEKCYKRINKQKRFSVKKEYFDTLFLREKMMEKLKSLKGKQRMADRSCIIEHVFGEIKEIFKFRRFLHRGLNKVRLIWNIICIAYNFRKLARIGYGYG